MISNRDIHCEDCEIKNLCIYQTLTTEQKQILNSKKIGILKKEGDHLFDQADFAQVIFIVRQGLIKHTKKIGEQEHVFSNFKKRAELTGLESIKKNTVYSSTAICLTETTLCAFPNYLIKSICVSNYHATEYIFEQLFLSVSFADEQIAYLSKGRAKKRVTEILLILYENLPYGENGLKVKREELAELSNIGRENISNQLAFLKKNKLIDVKKNYIKLLQPSKMQALLKDNYFEK